MGNCDCTMHFRSILLHNRNERITMKAKKEKLKKKELILPEIIKSDLTYYMQFGWKQIRPVNDLNRDARKYGGKVYSDRYMNNDY